MGGKTGRSSACTAVNTGDPALPVAGQGGLAHVRKSRNARRRAWVLLAVHAVIALHVTHYLVAGKTLSPVEPSEAMYTIELGQLNAGFIFLVVALLATLIFGRFFCGWGCHIVALQDLCGWMMKRIGIRPRPFRARLLLWGPMLLALYMFFWPTLKREVLLPLLVHWDWMPASSIPVLPALTNHLMTDAFWKTFPGPVFAVLTFLTCGFAAVYFLGAKGFCTYGCPYGALFAFVDRAAPMRIVVSDACEGCGHCTATCTSNVVVHEEVRRFGAVVDPGCMKCMDCVSVCPTNALSLGFTRPPMFGRAASGRPGARRYSLPLGEELGLVVVGLAAFFAFRGLYGGPPMLMSAGIGGITAFLALKLWHLARKDTVRVQNLALKVGGALSGSGKLFGVLTAAWLAFTAHSAVVQWDWAWGNFYRDRTEVSREEGLSGAFLARTQSERHQTAAARSLKHYSRADRWGLLPMIEVKRGLAWARILENDVDGAAESLGEVVALVPDSRHLHAERIQFLLAHGERDAAIAAFEQMIAAVPPAAEDHTTLASLLLEAGRGDEAAEQFRRALELSPSPAQHYNLGGVLRRLGRNEEAIVELREAARQMPDDADSRVELGLAYQATGQVDEAIAAFEEAIRLAPDTPEALYHLPGVIEELKRQR